MSNHSHGPTAEAGHTHARGTTDERRIALALGVIVLFMVVEIAGGIISGSLALLADAAHMISDAVALGMSWLAIHYGRRPADAARSFGYRRLEVLAAFGNGCALFLIAAWITFEAVRRLSAPAPVLGGTMLAVAIAGGLSNIVALWILNSGNKENLNVRSAWVHVLGDLLGSAAAVVAAGVILWTGWFPIDPILSVFVAVVILRSAWTIVRSSAHILLEGTPPGIDLKAMQSALEKGLPVGTQIHHIHAWALTAEQPLVTLHVRCAASDNVEAIMTAVKSRLKDDYGVTHSTIQVEPFLSEADSCRIGSPEWGKDAPPH